ncbi:MAG: acyl-CoA synthetase (NDP forming) [Candidatus Aldehydirespiratoraceae bacterium]|jgi:acyl-CoA synthetase (NDP forming)
MSGAPRVDLQPFFAPKGVALIGRVDRDAQERDLRAANDERWGANNWHLVNPRGGSIGSIPIHTSVNEIEAPIGLAIISTPAATCPEIVRQCGAAGASFALVFSSEFSEVGEAGAELERELGAAAEAAGVRLIGPNTNTNAFETFPDSDSAHGGRIGVVTQSGHNGRPIVQGVDLGLRFSRMIPTGNEVDIDVCDFIEYLAADDDTAVIAAYVEGFRDGDRLRHSLEMALESATPIVMMKIGASQAGARMAETHTGHIAGSDAIAQSILDRYGVCRVRDLDELLETSALFAKVPLTTGPRVALYSISGGSGTLMAEQAELHGVPLAELSAATQAKLHRYIPGHLTVANPIDNGGTFVMTQPPEIRREVLLAILEDPGVDSLIVGITGEVPPITNPLVADIGALARVTTKPIIATWNSPRVDSDAFRALVATGVPLFRSFRNCFLALAGMEAHRIARRSFRNRPRTSHPAAPLSSEPVEFLSHYGIATVPQRLVNAAADARKAVVDFGGHAVLKLASADIAHKSDHNLVRLDISPEKAADVFDDLLATAARRAPDAVVEGVLVQAMVTGVEMIVGGLRDPILGSAIVVGSGGIFAEVLDDRTVRPVPLDRRDAREMVESLRGYPLLTGVRGQPPADIDALVELIERVGQLIYDQSSNIVEFDLNPVIVGARGEGAFVADCLFLMEPQESDPVE